MTAFMRKQKTTFDNDECQTKVRRRSDDNRPSDIIPKNVHKHRISNKTFDQDYVVTFIEQRTVGVTLGTSHFVDSVCI